MELKVKGLSKSYHQKKVLDGVNFTFEDGKIYGLLGRNGSGKTTFFNAINEDIDIDCGDILLDKEKIDIRDIGYVTATPNVPEFLTGYEFLKFFLEINSEKIPNPKTISEYFDMVKIKEEDQNKIMKEYSHGMKNKMQLLIHIISNPKVLLLDEPLSSFDIVVQDEMKTLLKETKKGHILIFSTHILELALDLCDEIVVLNNKNLELISKESLNTKKYKDKIIKSLKEDIID